MHPTLITTPLFSYRKFWAKRFGVAPFLPMSRAEMDTLGWDSCDIIIITGDAYVDHPSFGMAIIGRLLEAQGFRVGMISQPNWKSSADFQQLGKPNLFFGVTAGNMDSMVNNYTADRKIRTDDAYSPNGAPFRRPNHAVIVYSQRCREAYKDVPIILGGIEASLRRFAHYDYWSDQVRRSVLIDAKADILVYGNGERAVVEIAHRLARREDVCSITDVRGTAIVLRLLSDSKTESKEQSGVKPNPSSLKVQEAIYLPSYEQVKSDKILFAAASHAQFQETNPLNARPFIQAHEKRWLWVNPPPIPLATSELDGVYDLPFARVPHPSYVGAKVPAYEMIRFSVNIMRGCFGGCTFCAITAHEGRIIQSRSLASVKREIENVRDKTPGFTGIISDLGGPTANMYQLYCCRPEIQAKCRRLSCLYPGICKNLNTNHQPLITLYRETRGIYGIKKVLIGSGVRYDLALKAPDYINELVSHHVGGYLKIAPEHIAPGPLAQMMKPGIDKYEEFKKLFAKYSAVAKKEQYLIPYFIAAHPGTTDADMVTLALWLKANKYRLDQVQNFLPTPMTLATTMYYAEINPLTVSWCRKPIEGAATNETKNEISNHEIDKNKNSEREIKKVYIPRSGKTRRFHKALLRYHDPANWPIIREGLRQMGRADLIGKGKNCLVPAACTYKHRR